MMIEYNANPACRLPRKYGIIIESLGGFMVYLYLVFILYVGFAAAYIVADYGNRTRLKRATKIPAGVLYLCIALLAFFLNRVDGKLTAVQHFAWVFSAMLCCFAGDMVMLGAGGSKKRMMLGMLAFFAAHLLLTVYFTLYLLRNGAPAVSPTVILIILSGAVLAVLFLRIKKLDLGTRGFKALAFVFFMSSVIMLAKAVSLVKMMNTNASWPTVVGVLFMAVSDFFLAYKYFSTEKSTYALGTALALYFAGMAVLPLSIYYI
jgi:hypothetical protein